MGKVERLLQSRKFWAGTVALAVSALLWWQGLITADQFSRALVIVVGLYMGSVALEDGLAALFAVMAQRDRDLMRAMRDEAERTRDAMLESSYMRQVREKTVDCRPLTVDERRSAVTSQRSPEEQGDALFR